MTTQLNSSHGLYDPHYEHDSCGVGMVAQDRESRNVSVNLRNGAADFFYDGVNKL